MAATGPTLAFNEIDGVWFAEVLDGGPQYVFLSTQAAETFARSVASGDMESILDSLEQGNISTIHPPGEDQTPEEIYENMFNVCSDIQVNDIPWTEGDVEQLSEELEQVGEFVVEMMGLAAARKKHMATQEERRKTLASWLPTSISLTSGVSKKTKPTVSVKKPIGNVLEATRATSLGAVSPDFSLTWTNWSKDTMDCIYWEVDLSAVTGTVISDPPDTLPQSFQAGLSWYQLISGLAAGNNKGWVLYQAPNGQEFGVRITVPVQVFGIGKAPYWQVSTDGGSTWFNKSTSDPYTFPDIMGYDVTVTPTAGHSNLYLSVTINDLAGKEKRVKRVNTIADVERVRAKLKARTDKAKSP